MSFTVEGILEIYEGIKKNGKILAFKVWSLELDIPLCSEWPLTILLNLHAGDNKHPVFYQHRHHINWRMLALPWLGFFESCSVLSTSRNLSNMGSGVFVTRFATAAHLHQSASLAVTYNIWILYYVFWCCHACGFALWKACDFIRHFFYFSFQLSIIPFIPTMCRGITCTCHFSLVEEATNCIVRRLSGLRLLF